MRLSVVMVNYNTGALAEACLRSLREHLAVDSVEVILVDNASSGFDAAPLTAAWPGLKVIESKENLGFGRGNNLGATQAIGEYLWLLNTDTLLEAGNGVERMLDFLDAHPTYAAASPMLQDDSGTVQPWQTAYFPSPWRMVLSPGARLAARLSPKLAPRLAWLDTNFAPEAPADVDQAVAAALVVRRSVFVEIGGFSPAYFFFLEDTDLCRRIAARGLRIRWLPDVKVVHLWGRSVSDPVRRQNMFFSAQDIYFRTWGSPASHLLIRALRLPLRYELRLRTAVARGRAGRLPRRPPAPK